jgi:hypothetical protein
MAINPYPLTSAPPYGRQGTRPARPAATARSTIASAQKEQPDDWRLDALALGPTQSC